MPDHTVKAFDADLANLARMVAEMHEQVEEQLKVSVEALVRNDDRLVKRVLALDENNAALNRNIEANVILVLTRRQPVAHDLRFIIAIWETAIELSRVSGIARGIVNRAITLGNFHPLPSAAQGLRRLTRATLQRLREAVNSLILFGKAEGSSIANKDFGSTYESLCRELLTYMMADPSVCPSVIQSLFCAKGIESIGEQVTNIADAVQYFEKGQRISRSGLPDTPISELASEAV